MPSTVSLAPTGCKCVACGKCFEQADLLNHLHTVHKTSIEDQLLNLTNQQRVRVPLPISEECIQTDKIICDDHDYCTPIVSSVSKRNSIASEHDYCGGINSSFSQNTPGCPPAPASFYEPIAPKSKDGQFVFCCLICGPGNHFDNKRQLMLHRKLKHKSTKNRKQEQKKKQTIEGNGAFCCLDCGQRFDSEFQLLLHHQLKHVPQKEKDMKNKKICPICHKEFSCNFTLREHFRIHTGEQPFVCPHCGRRFNQKITLTRHILTHTGERPFKCKYCDASYKGKHYLVCHIRSKHTFEKPFKCVTCAKRFVSTTLLRVHTRNVHEGYNRVQQKRVFTCDDCHVQFNDKGRLLRHVILEHLHESLPFVCQICDQDFLRQSGLVRHQELHQDAKQFKCFLCDYCGRTAEVLRAHCKRHSKLRPTFVCDSCGKEYVNKDMFTNHVLDHEGVVKRFSCLYCPYTNHYRATLYYHMAVVHAGVKRFKCRFCAYRCGTRSMLEQHERIHKNVKPYPCPYCPLKCRDSTTLRRHIDAKHLGGKHKCMDCGKMFVRHDTLMGHLRVHHKRNNCKIKCDICGQMLDNKTMLEEHRKNEHNYACTL